MKAMDVKLPVIQNQQRLLKTVNLKLKEKKNIYLDYEQSSQHMDVERAERSDKRYAEKIGNLNILTDVSGNIHGIYLNGEEIFLNTESRKTVAGIIGYHYETLYWITFYEPKFKEARDTEEFSKSPEYLRTNQVQADKRKLNDLVQNLKQATKGTVFELDDFNMIAKRAAREDVQNNDSVRRREVTTSVKAELAASTASRSDAYNFIRAFDALYEYWVAFYQKNKSANRALRNLSEKIEQEKIVPISPYVSSYVDKSGYVVEIDKYLKLRSHNFLNSPDAVQKIVERIKERYTRFLEEELSPLVVEMLKTEQWEKIRILVSNMQQLKTTIDSFFQWVEDIPEVELDIDIVKYQSRSIMSRLFENIKVYREVKESYEAANKEKL